MPVIPGWLVFTLVSAALGANIGNPIGQKLVRDAHKECARKANGQQWQVKSSIDRKKGVKMLECHVKQAPPTK